MNATSTREHPDELVPSLPPGPGRGATGGAARPSGRSSGASPALLDGNKRVLKVIADMEEKSQGEHLFDINYIRSSRAEVREGVADIVEKMIALGGERYAALRERHAAIEAEIDAVLEGRREVPEDDYTIPFARLDRSRADSVGGKSAQLGELTSRLRPAGAGGLRGLGLGLQALRGRQRSPGPHHRAHPGRSTSGASRTSSGPAGRSRRW